METVTYWERRKVNIGHYEDIEFGLTYARPVKEINNKDRLVELSHSENVDVSNTEEFGGAALKAVSRVRKVLDMREKKIREACAKIDTDMELDHLEKLEAMGIEASKQIKNKKDIISKKKIQNNLTDDDEFDS